MKYRYLELRSILQLAWWIICAGGGLMSSVLHAETVNLQGYVMHVQMTPAACALDPSKQKQRKCLEGYSLTITGLMPETTKTDCSTESSATLSPLQAKVVARVMPDNNARVQLWKSVGGCVPMNASQYFRTVINFAERLKIPASLTSSTNVEMQQSALRQQFVRLNPSLPQNGIRFSCQLSRSDVVLTEVKVCYTVKGQYKQCANHVVSNCPGEIMIKGSY
ncbi:ribonuclease I [Acinetobacter pittii]|uniref:ribonuclease T2 family protein n=1 Tax=Acinetobacter pittii TaxID=48296 RepID=UPI00313F2142